MNKVVLGYHSPTEWIFFPESVVLYGSFTINKDVYEKAVTKGQKSPSGYENVKANLLIELKNRGTLLPIEYEVPSSKKKAVEALFDWFIKNRSNELRNCAITATQAFKNHELATYDKLVSKDDPCYINILELIPVLEKMEKNLKSDLPLWKVPRFRDTFVPYFEEILLTPYPEDYNPVFTWEGYSQFSNLLLRHCFPDNEQFKSQIKKGTQYKVIKTVAELCLPFRPFRKPKELENLLEKCLELDDIRKLIGVENKKTWKELEKAMEVNSHYYSDFSKHFEDFIQKRIQNINELIQDAKQGIETKESTLSCKIARSIILTLSSIIPGTGGLGFMLENLYAKFIEKKTCIPPSAKAILDYEQALDKVSLKRGPIAPHSEIKADYQKHHYWLD